MFDYKIIGSNTDIVIPAGIHYLTEPVIIKGRNIRITGEDGAVMRGSVKLCRSDFTETETGVFSASVPCLADAFYIGEKKYTMARYPKADHPDDIFGGYAADCVLPEKTKDWSDPSGGYIHAIHKHMWGGYSYKIERKNDDGTLALSGGWQNNRQMGMHRDFRFAENIREEMTQEGEWYFDEKNMRIDVRLADGDDLDKAEIAVSRGFFILDDCEDVMIGNITFERSVRTFMETKEPLLRSDWTIYRGGAILVKNSANCAIDRCVFSDIGSNGVFVGGNCENIHVTRSHFTKIGASGICFVGCPDSVRSPLFECGETHKAEEIDRKPGPASDNYPKNCDVDNCLISCVGQVEKQAAGVEISMAYGISVTNCTICHTSRAGINISEGTFGGHRIEGCDVFDTVRETGDHGSFNSWGRDRYWHLEGIDDCEIGALAYLDCIAPVLIRRNRFRCDHGWDIDLDDGSSNYRIEENLCLNGGIKLREGFGRIVRHNITVNNTIHFHVWYPKSGDIVEDNIVFAPYAPIGMPAVWGSRVNNNILHVPGCSKPETADELCRMSYDDRNSIKIDCVFAAPDTGNYIPQNENIAGFTDFPTEFGVRFAPLCEIADVPVLPAIHVSEKSDRTVIVHWCGMSGKNIENDGEMSVYGTAGHNGVLVMTVEKNSSAEIFGLREHDVITGIDRTVITNISDIPQWKEITSCEIQVLRKQTPVRLSKQ